MGQRAGLPPDQRRTQRAIVFQLLREDRPERWTREQLAHAVKADPHVLDTAIASLIEHAVIVAEADAFRAAPPTCYLLDALEVIGI